MSPRNVMQPLLSCTASMLTWCGTAFDFNMSAFSTDGDVYPEFAAPGNAHLWGIGGLDESHKDRTGSLIMPRRPYTWSVHQHGCLLHVRQRRPRVPVFLHFHVTNLPGPSSVMRSAQAQRRRLERAAGKNERERLSKRPAQQSTPSAPSTQPQTSSASTATPPTMPQQPASPAKVGKLPSQHTIGSTLPNAVSVCPHCSRLRQQLLGGLMVVSKASICFSGTNWCGHFGPVRR